MGAKFGLVDERDTQRENTVEAFRVALWWGDPDDEEGLTAVEVLESADATLDETIEFAAEMRRREPRLIQIFAVSQSNKKESWFLAAYRRDRGGNYESSSLDVMTP